MIEGIYVQTGGSEGTPFVFIHGLGATGDVWSGLLPGLGSRRWVVLDLPGHGSSLELQRYSPFALARAIAPVIPADAVLVGHSLGGVVALALAAPTFATSPLAVFGIGIKVAWSEGDLGGMMKMASRPRQEFDTRGDALLRAQRLAGVSSGNIRRAVRRTGRRWEPSFDPRAFGVGAPNMDTLVGQASCPVHLACGEHDPMVDVGQLRGYDPRATCLPGLGHNAMLDSPAAIISWLDSHVC